MTRNDPGTPEICNIYHLHQHFSPATTVEDVARKCRTAGWGCLDCKRVLADNITAHFAPIRERAAELKRHPRRVREILMSGAERAREVARDTMQGVRHRMGLLPAQAEELVRK